MSRFVDLTSDELFVVHHALRILARVATERALATALADEAWREIIARVEQGVNA